MKRTKLLTRILVGWTASLSLALVACRPDGQAGDASKTEAITNRPQGLDRFIAMLRLTNPPLLSSAVKQNGKLVVDQTLKQAILAEQDQEIKALQALSPEIQVLYRYRLVLNGLAVVAPKSLENQLKQMDQVSDIDSDSQFERMAPAPTPGSAPESAIDLQSHNSGTFIGAAKVRDELKFTGKGITVGVIDTGIDYTHAMFGGAGTPEAYRAVDPAAANPQFPTDKVVGGIDLVGTDYDSGSPNFAQHLPHPDQNPLDEAGHGSHVAGTIAGHGDGINTYDGMAPDAKLYAIKIFGKTGSAGDAVIVAALEKAANPRGDLDPSDHLDVVNLSLGGDFGTAHTLYTEAVGNLVAHGDVLMCASAGNSGDNAYIVSNPSAVDQALSVAASVDDSAWNWQFRDVLFKTAAHPETYTQAIEASFGTPIADAGNVTGKLVYVGNAAADFDAATKAALKGNVALVDRGVAGFADKAKRAADAGAIGLVVADNVPGDPIAMGGDGSYAFPAIMIPMDLGNQLKTDMQSGDASITFKTTHTTLKPELIDTLADFSSRGPRSIDGHIKPEISAPGYNVVSAKMGSGKEGVKFSGTSMAAPHMTGAMALLRQAHPELDAPSLKALVMATALPIKDAKAAPYPVSAMGSGRIQVYQAATAKLFASPPALSFGEVLVEQTKTVHAPLTLTNLGDQDLTVQITPNVKPGLTVTAPKSVTLKPHASQTFDVHVQITPPAATDASQELDGFLQMTSPAGVYHVPLLAVVDRTTRLAAKSLVIHATSDADATGAEADLTLVNAGRLPGEALLFNLLGTNPRNLAPVRNPDRNGVCNLESAGWRIVKTKVNGTDTDLLQVAVKIYNPVTSWQLCDVSVLFNADGTDQPSQELVGTYLQSLDNNDADWSKFASALTDATKMRQIRLAFEKAGSRGEALPDYTPAIVDTQPYAPYAHSTIAVVSADLKQIAKTPTGDLRLKIVVQGDGASPDQDNYLGPVGQWLTLTPTDAGQAYVGLPETVAVAAGQTQTVSLTKGGADGDLVVYLPYDRSIQAPVGTDAQQAVPQVTIAQ